MEKKKFILIMFILIAIIGLIGLGFVGVKMVDKWIARKATAEAAQKVVGGITRMLPMK